jgi:hypothetical protein
VTYSSSREDEDMKKNYTLTISQVDDRTPCIDYRNRKRSWKTIVFQRQIVACKEKLILEEKWKHASIRQHFIYAGQILLLFSLKNPR